MRIVVIKGIHIRGDKMTGQVNLMYKLQKALLSKGYIIMIGSYQKYISEENKFIKIYNIKHGGEVVLNSSSCIKFVKYMADCYKEICEHPEILDWEEREQNSYMDEHCRKW